MTDSRHTTLRAWWWDEVEPLWIASLALLILLPGFQFGAAIIRFFGRGGQQETVEWLTYLSVLVGLPIGAWLVSYALPRLGSAQLQTRVKLVLLVFVALEVLVYLVRSEWYALLAATALSVVTVFALRFREGAKASAVVTRQDAVGWAVLVFVGICAWMAAGSLVSWGDATPWFIASVARFAVFVASFAISVLAVRSTFHPRERTGARSTAARALAAVGVLVLLALSFRTNPVLELYHWEAYVGPMQELRQGGWLLWDAPAQYGLLSILIPTLLPGNSWQSFYLCQAICNVIVALLMFWGLGGTRLSPSRVILATALTATTLFFRPRSATLLLAAQMTPSGGPVRFLWPFIMLAFVFHYYRRSASRRTGATVADLRFELGGNLIWLGSLCWSAEAAIYCGGVWFPAYALFLMRRASRQLQSGRTKTKVVLRIIRSIGWLAGGVILLVVAVSLFYRVVLGTFPDWMGYVEYALLYSGGFHSLPIDPSGSIWYLLIIFLAIATALVIYLFRDWAHPRAMVLAGAWGGVWAISSYFVSRSAAANLLSIGTFLVFALAISLTVIAEQPRESWHELLRVAVVPIFATPIALTLAHPAFVTHITTSQLSYSSFTEQIPFMEPSLNALLLEAGAKPSDPVVRIGDARLMLPAWRVNGPGKTRIVSPYSWLPKQYEIIGTLPRERRIKYIDRMASHLRLSGWLIHSKKDGIPDFDKQLADISRTHVETKRFENKDWIVSWYQLKR
jgi:hypothetical protein